MEDKKKIKEILINFRNMLKDNNSIKKDYQLQKIYDTSDYESLICNIYDYALTCEKYILATGQSGYFTEQISKNGLGSMKINKEDSDDIKYIASYFGKEIFFDEALYPITYTVMLKSSDIVLNYAEQTFPAGIFEDVLGLSVSHELPFEPIVGETEDNYFLRVLNYQIDNNPNCYKSKKNEIIEIAKKLIPKFCNIKNRIYLMYLKDVLEYKASFGDSLGLRNDIQNDDTKKAYDNLLTLEKLMEQSGITENTVLYDANMNSEYGIAIYNVIPTSKLKYIEIEHKYNLMQKRALELGYQSGDKIPLNILLQSEKGMSRS